MWKGNYFSWQFFVLRSCFFFFLLMHTWIGLTETSHHSFSAAGLISRSIDHTLWGWSTCQQKSEVTVKSCMLGKFSLHTWWSYVHFTSWKMYVSEFSCPMWHQKSDFFLLHQLRSMLPKLWTQLDLSMMGCCSPAVVDFPEVFIFICHF